MCTRPHGDTSENTTIFLLYRLQVALSHVDSKQDPTDDTCHYHSLLHQSKVTKTGGQLPLHPRQQTTRIIPLLTNPPPLPPSKGQWPITCRCKHSTVLSRQQFGKAKSCCLGQHAGRSVDHECTNSCRPVDHDCTKGCRLMDLDSQYLQAGGS